MKNKWFSRVLIILFIWLFAYYFFNHIVEFKALIDLNPIILGLIAIGYITSIYTSGIFNKVIIVPYGKYISRIEGFRVALISSIGNYFGPLLGGTGMRAGYLKKKVGLSYTDFISTLYGYYIIVFLTSSILGLLSLILLKDKHPETGYLILLAFFVTVTFTLLFVIYNKIIPFSYRLIKFVVGKKVSRLSRLAISWSKIIKYEGMIPSLIKITFINILLLALINYLEFRSIGISLGLGSLLLYTSLGIFSILISLTPGALGIREAIFLFSASVMSVSSTEILAVALIDRSIQFIVMAFGWILSTSASRYFKQDFNKLTK